jgi:heme exporter protein D
VTSAVRVTIWIADHAPYVIAAFALIVVAVLLNEAYRVTRGRHHMSRATRARGRTWSRQRKAPGQL